MTEQTQFTDKMIMNMILDHHKLAASSLTNLILESSSNSLRKDAMNLLTQCLDHQKKIFDAMSKRGWYQPSPAGQDQIAKAQQMVKSMESQWSM